MLPPMNRHFRFVDFSICLATILGSLTMVAVQGAEPTPQVELKLLAEGMTAPIALSSLTDGSGQLIVADQVGVIHLLNREGQRQEKLFLDLREKLVPLNQGMEERGICGLALHPQFKNNHKFYVAYNGPLRASAPADWNNTMRISEFHTVDGSSIARR